VPDIAPIKAVGRANGNAFNVTRRDPVVKSAARGELPAKVMRLDFAGALVSRQEVDTVGRRNLSRSLYLHHQSAGGIYVTRASKERREIIRGNPFCYSVQVPMKVFESFAPSKNEAYRVII
jgi:hypothetical protein